MRTHASAGFSIVELLITLAVAAIAVVVVSSMYSSAGRLSDRTSDLLAANSLAYSKLQAYENMNFSSIPYRTDTQPVEDFSTQVPTSLPGPRVGYVYVSQQSATLKYIFVRVKYGDAAAQQQHVIEYGDFVQAGGLGR